MLGKHYLASKPTENSSTFMSYVYIAHYQKFASEGLSLTTYYTLYSQALGLSCLSCKKKKKTKHTKQKLFFNFCITVH